MQLTSWSQRLEVGEALGFDRVRSLLELEVLHHQPCVDNHQQVDPGYAAVRTSNSAPAIHFHPLSSALCTTSARTPLGSTSRCLPVSGVINLKRKNGILRSHGNRLNVDRSIEARRSRYPFARLETISSLEYVTSWTCYLAIVTARGRKRASSLSQPKMTEQKPKPSDLAAERNLSLDMIFPRRTPSMSTPDDIS